MYFLSKNLANPIIKVKSPIKVKIPGTLWIGSEAFEFLILGREKMVYQSEHSSLSIYHLQLKPNPNQARKDYLQMEFASLLFPNNFQTIINFFPKASHILDLSISLPEKFSNSPSFLSKKIPLSSGYKAFLREHYQSARSFFPTVQKVEYYPGHPNTLVALDALFRFFGIYPNFAPHNVLYDDSSDQPRLVFFEVIGVHPHEFIENMKINTSPWNQQFIDLQSTGLNSLETLLNLLKANKTLLKLVREEIQLRIAPIQETTPFAA